MRCFIHADKKYLDRWYIRYCKLVEQLHGKFIKLDALERLDLVEGKYQEGDFFLGRFAHKPLEKRKTSIVLPRLIKIFGDRCFPQPNLYEHYDDKLAQYLFFKDKNYPIPDTIYATCRGDAENFLRKHGYPLILKTRTGVSSKGVKMIKNIDQLTYPILLQKFCKSDDNGDYRVVVIGERVIAFKRNNKPDDFRASGSDDVEFKKDYNLEMIMLAKRISKENEYTCMAYDIMKHQNRWLLLEKSYTFPCDRGFMRSPFYYDENLAKIEKKGIMPQDFIVEDLFNGKNTRSAKNMHKLHRIFA